MQAHHGNVGRGLVGRAAPIQPRGCNRVLGYMRGGNGGQASGAGEYARGLSKSLMQGTLSCGRNGSLACAAGGGEPAAAALPKELEDVRA